MASGEVERECRICRGEDEASRPLLHPCRCSGSIKFTHEDCLVNWLAQSGSSRCELCGHSFRFEPLYQPNTPSALATREFVLGVLALMHKTMRTAARIVLVLAVWLFFLPLGTCWTWYALFINSPAQLPALLASRGPTGVAADAFYGCLLSAGIVFIFLGVSSLREYVRHFPQEGEEGEFEEMMEEQQGQEVEGEDEVFAEVDELVRDTYEVIAGGESEEEGEEEDILAEESEPEEELFEEGAEPEFEPEGEFGAEGEVEGGALFGLFDLDPEDVPLEEVVGLRGHIRNLFDNAGTVLVSNAIFLGVFTLIPLLIGRLTLRVLSLSRFAVRLNVSYDENFLKAVVKSLGGEKGFTVDVVRGNVTEVEKVGRGQEGPLVSYVDNFLIVLLGYGMIALAAVGYIGVVSVLRKKYPRLDSPVTRQIARLLRYVATFVKIVVLILFEFGIFPLGCGWWLDMCTLEILGGSLQSRVDYCQQSPWTCTGAHWVLGIVYMVHISLFISLLREVVKPQLLWFLRNPDDPEFHPFRELVEKPLSRHARRMCISVIIYVPLILALVYAPSQLCLKLLPHVFPFRSEDFSHILIDVPFGNLLIGPLIRLLYFGRPGVSLHHVVAAWVKWVSGALGIAHLVVKDEADEQEERRRRNGGAEGDAGPLQRMLGEHDELLDAGVELPEPLEDEEEEQDGLSHRDVRVRAIVMILLAWLSLIIAESVIIAVPTMLGRSMMRAVGLPVRHDLHPFLLGLNVLFGTVSGVVKVVKYVQSVDTVTALSSGLPYLYLAAKGVFLVNIWLGAIPLAAGLLFELILVPIRVGHDETPYFCLHQDWALGLLLLKVWTCIAVTGGLGQKWRERVLRAREGDLMGWNQNFGRTMREVVLPVLVSVVTALSVPYSIARGVLPMLGVARWVSNMVYRYAYLVVAGGYCGWESIRYSVSILRELHDSIRDDKYLVGKRLYNFVEGGEVETEGERENEVEAEREVTVEE